MPVLSPGHVGVGDACSWASAGQTPALVPGQPSPSQAPVSLSDGVVLMPESLEMETGLGGQWVLEPWGTL